MSIEQSFEHDRNDGKKSLFINTLCKYSLFIWICIKKRWGVETNSHQFFFHIRLIPMFYDPCPNVFMNNCGTLFHKSQPYRRLNIEKVLTKKALWWHRLKRACKQLDIMNNKNSLSSYDQRRNALKSSYGFCYRNKRWAKQERGKETETNSTQFNSWCGRHMHINKMIWW